MELDIILIFKTQINSKDIKQGPESDLKDFLVKAIEAPNPYNSIDEKNLSCGRMNRFK